MDIKYSNAFSEVLVLFDNFLLEDDYNKIPKEQIEFMKKNSNLDYIYEIDESKDLMDQDVSKEAKAVILSLFKSYFADNEKKKKIDYYLMLNDKERYLEEINLINKKEDNYIENKNLQLSNEPMEKSLIVKKENIFKRFFNKIIGFVFRK
ncbi:MAG: hypothetical protein J6J60_01335 [Clostridia bacterium]|nr:hypothetical protein [Clostridia bacterium]